MREILFRGKRLDKGEWAYGSLIHVREYCCILGPCNEPTIDDLLFLDAELGTIDGRALPVNPETIGQFTGFVDKYGRRIFEGDVVLHRYGMHNEKTLYFEVTYDEDFGLWYPFGGRDHGGYLSNELEVIGNIHEPRDLKI